MKVKVVELRTINKDAYATRGATGFDLHREFVAAPMEGGVIRVYDARGYSWMAIAIEESNLFFVTMDGLIVYFELI